MKLNTDNLKEFWNDYLTDWNRRVFMLVWGILWYFTFSLLIGDWLNPWAFFTTYVLLDPMCFYTFTYRMFP